MDNSEAERFIPQKKYLRQTSKQGQKPTRIKGRGIGQGLKTAGPVAAAAVGLSSVIFPTQAKNVVEYAAHNLTDNAVVRQAEESLGEKYSQLVDRWDRGAEKETSIPEVKQNDDIVDLLYPGLTDEERFDLNSQLQNERLIIKEQYLSDVSAENVEALLPIISQSANSEGIPSEVLFGMVIIESKFDPYNFNEDSGAKGLTQMMDTMAEAHELNISYADVKNNAYDKFTDIDDRYDPKLILAATAKELAISYGRWGDWGLAAWEWHAGAPNIYAAIQMYIEDVSNGQDILPDIVGVDDEDLSRQLAGLYRNKIAEYQINLLRLLKNPVVVREFSGPGWDSTLIYVMRALAAVEEYHAKAGHPHTLANLQGLPKAA